MPAATTGPERTFFDLPEETLKQVVDLNLEGSILPARSRPNDGGSGGGDHPQYFFHERLSAADTRCRIQRGQSGGDQFYPMAGCAHGAGVLPNIRVNAIAPGFFHTSQNHFLLYDEKTGALTSGEEHHRSHAHEAIRRAARSARRRALALVPGRPIRHRRRHRH